MNLVSRFTVVRRLSFNNKRKKKQRFIPFDAIIFVSDGLRILLLKGEMSKTFEMRSVGNRMCIRWVCIRIMQKRKKKRNVIHEPFFIFYCIPKRYIELIKKQPNMKKTIIFPVSINIDLLTYCEKKITEIYIARHWEREIEDVIHGWENQRWDMLWNTLCNRNSNLHVFFWWVSIFLFAK